MLGSIEGSGALLVLLFALMATMLTAHRSMAPGLPQPRQGRALLLLAVPSPIQWVK